MYEISLPTAELIYTGSNVLVVIGALLGVIGGIGVFYSGGIRDKFSEVRTKSLETKSAQALAEAARANAEAARANERTAILNKEAAALRVELARRTQPLAARVVTPEQKQKLKRHLSGKGCTVGLMWPSSEAEVAGYAASLREALSEATVTVNSMGSPTVTLNGQRMIGDGLTLYGPRSIPLERALDGAGITFNRAAEIEGVRIGMPTLVVGSRPPLKD